MRGTVRRILLRSFVPVVATGVLLGHEAQANLISNPSFEEVPCATPCNLGQGVMPTGWFNEPVGSDTFSNDGSYGVSPGDFGHFPGVIAQDGLRWVAGSSSFPPYLSGEIVGQTLSAPLSVSSRYTLSAFVHRDTGTTGSAQPEPGSWQIELWNSTDSTVANVLVLGQLGIVSGDAWEQTSLDFTAPIGADTHQTVVFRPISGSSTAAYPGLDNLSLTMVPVPAPATLPLFAAGLAGLGILGWRKRKAA